MATKYYAHFLLQEPGHDCQSEYSGVVEVSSVSGRPVDGREIEAILANNLAVDTDDVTVLDWSRIH